MRLSNNRQCLGIVIGCLFRADMYCFLGLFEMKAETYWGRRCILNENVLCEYMKILSHLLPPALLDADASLRDQWQSKLDELDEEFKE